MFNKLFFTAVALLLFASCKKTRGCTDSEALNYNPDAAKDDRSCYYYWIGQNYGGGKVFYIDITKKHGLIAAHYDLPGTKWGDPGILVAGADGTDVGTGYQNTVDIVNTFSTITAASLCFDYDTLGFDDWYLPSLQEMKGLEKAFGALGQGGITSGYYWTSSELNALSAHLVMGANSSTVSLSKSVGYSVRAIRSF
jgi:hypothetical protein